MSTYDDALVEKAARALCKSQNPGGGGWGYADQWRQDARAVLDAVAEDLRAEGATTTWVRRMVEREVAHDIEDLEAERDRWKQRWRDTVAADQERMALAWDEGYDAASTCHCAAYNEDECGCGYYGSEPIYRDENPYGEERDDARDMCPNCVTPWKCNGPHEERA